MAHQRVGHFKHVCVKFIHLLYVMSKSITKRDRFHALFAKYASLRVMTLCHTPFAGGHDELNTLRKIIGSEIKDITAKHC